ncbi:tRNA lysidine(34) synthetase TilS [Kiloniella sp.]|uniref:tRNA lysidine(34) synthetase TilS n=1 Tax=Kiloniella sp. TaxID=1938587 RepID=UPI003B010201
MSALILPQHPLKIAVALSGGADSMALCLLLKEWVDAHDGELIAVTVDHTLRPESEFEAKWIHARLTSEGVEHHILSWQKELRATGSTQVLARDARYRLMSQWCQQRSISLLALAHHLDDQIETLLIRLLRNSGSDGLAGMSLQRREGQLNLIRPLLSVSKERLLATLRDRGWGWIEEPSNHQDKYLRNRLRRAMPNLELGGLKKETLARICHSLGRIRRNLQERTDAFINKCVVVKSSGYATIDYNESIKADSEILTRALERTLLTIGGGNYSPRSERTKRLVRELHDGTDVKVTLAGCHVKVKQGVIAIARETRNLPEVPLSSEGDFLWDNRFYIHIHGAMKDAGLILKALGKQGWQQLCQLSPHIKESAIPMFARYSLPAVFLGDKIITVPHLEYLDSAWLDKLRIKMRFKPKNILIQHPFTVA